MLWTYVEHYSTFDEFYRRFFLSPQNAYNLVVSWPDCMCGCDTSLFLEGGRVSSFFFKKGREEKEAEWLQPVHQTPVTPTKNTHAWRKEPAKIGWLFFYCLQQRLLAWKWNKKYLYQLVASIVLQYFSIRRDLLLDTYFSPLLSWGAEKAIWCHGHEDKGREGGQKVPDLICTNPFTGANWPSLDKEGGGTRGMEK